MIGTALSERERRAALARPSLESRADIAAVALEVINTVRAAGRRGSACLHRALRRREARSSRGIARGIRRGPEGTDFACRSPPSSARSTTSSRFHEAQVPKPFAMETMPGVRCERIIRPIQAVGLYVPAGSAPLPSAVIMLAVPARIAGCPRRVLVHAHRTVRGIANAAVLVAARDVRHRHGIQSGWRAGDRRPRLRLGQRPQGRQDIRAGQCLGDRGQTTRRPMIPPAPRVTCRRGHPRCW